MIIAFFPVLFALEEAMPLAIPIEMCETIDIAAPPSAVWNAPTDNEPTAVGQA